MISPNCPVIMDATSTTSSYNAIEKNARTERMRSDVGDSTDRLTENELLEEQNQDPEDEDTLSDDSLRLRLSDDEADDSRPDARDESTASRVSSEQTTTPQDTAMGLTDFDEKVVPLNNEVKSSVHKSHRLGCYNESRKSNHVLGETNVGGKKNINNMWRGGGRKEHSSNNTIHFAKRPLRGQSGHVRYYSHSNAYKPPSYFNNHDNFGRPPNYQRRYGSNWNYSKARHLHGSTRNVQRNAVKEQASKPKTKSQLKSDVEIQLLQSNLSPPHPPNLVGRASFNVVNNDSSTDPLKTTEHSSANGNSARSLAVDDKKNNDSSPIIHNELSKECSHLNLDEESNCDSKGFKSVDCNDISWKDYKEVSNCSYDSKFTCDDWFDQPHATNDKDIQSTGVYSPLLSQDSSNFQGGGSTTPVDGTQSAVRLQQKNETDIEVTPLPQNVGIVSFDLSMKTTELDIGCKTSNVKLDNNDEIDVPNNDGTKVDTNDLLCEAKKEFSEIDNSLEPQKDYESDITSSQLCSAVDQAEEMEMLQKEGNNVDKTDEVNTDSKPDNADQKLQSSNEDDAENKEKIENTQTDNSTPNRQEVTEQSMEIVVESKEAGKVEENRSEKIVSADVDKEINVDRPIEVAECVLEKPKLLGKVRDTERKRSVCSETSHESSCNPERNLTKIISLKPGNNIETQPPPIMKRSLPEADTVADKFIYKRMKIAPDTSHGVVPKQLKNLTTTVTPSIEKETIAAEKCQETPKPLHYVRKFFQRDMKGKMSKLKREELEELIIQKLVETITMRSEIGRLREQARISERNQEATRLRCQQLSKQIKDFDMVLSRNAVDRRSNNDKPVPPIKINRSVGLQVNFVTEHGIQSLRALTTGNAAKTKVPSPVTVNGGKAKAVPEKISNTTPVPRRGIKVRSPRRVEAPKSSVLSVQAQTSTAMPAALVISKPADTSQNLSILNNNKEQVLPNVTLAQPAAPKVQSIVINGKISNQVNRQTVVPSNHKAASNDLIDLTEEEDKNRSISSSTSNVLPMVGTVTSSIATKVPHSRYPRVVQTALPGNVAITAQPANIRVVQSVAQPTPTALVNNINATRVAYVMQRSPGTGRQLLIAPNPNQIRPASSARAQFPNMTYNSGISTLPNGTVRVMTTAASAIPNSQPPPAPLPDTPHYPAKNGWKLPPPPPSLKISKVTQGIVLSWNMAQSENYADIASYQLYAYQEIPGTPPNSNLWKKVGDVRALPLPMACTLKEFTPGNNYHFAVRAVDTHSRLGQYSLPKNISL